MSVGIIFGLVVLIKQFERVNIYDISSNVEFIDRTLERNYYNAIEDYHNVVDIILSLYTFVDIVGGGHHVIFPHRLLNYFSLLHTCNKAVVNA